MGENVTQPSLVDLKAGAPRNIALVIDHWSDATVLWAWTKSNFLRRQPSSEATALHPSDRLFIVRPRSSEDNDPSKWRRGGPLIKDIESALERYPHTVLQLDSPFKSSLGKFVKDWNIDIVIVGDEFHQKAFHLGQTVADFVRQHTSVPFIIMRPGAVRSMHGFRLDPSQNLSHNLSSGFSRAHSGKDLSPTRAIPVPGRRIAISYPSSFAVGRAIIAAARRLVLLPTDEIFLVHAFPKDKSVVHQTKKFVRTVTLQKHAERREVTEDSSMHFGAVELDSFPHVHLDVCLKGDPRTVLPSFCEKENIHLLILGTHTEGIFRKTFSGGSVSGTLVERCPCLCLLLPYSYLGVTPSSQSMSEYYPTPIGTQNHDLDRSSTTYRMMEGGGSPVAVSPKKGGAMGLQMVGSPSFGTTRGSGELNADAVTMVASLKRELVEKDRVIAELQAALDKLKTTTEEGESEP